MEEKRQGPTGIYIGPGSKGVVTRGNKITGFATGIEDHGEASLHDSNDIDQHRSGMTPIPAAPATHVWYQRPLGVVALAVIAGVLATAIWYLITKYAL